MRWLLLLASACTVGGDSAPGPPQLLTTGVGSVARVGDEVWVASRERGQGVWRYGPETPHGAPIALHSANEFHVDLVGSPAGFAVAVYDVGDLGPSQVIWLFDLRSGEGRLRRHSSRLAAGFYYPVGMLDDQVIVGAASEQGEGVVSLALDGDPASDRWLLTFGEGERLCSWRSTAHALILLTGEAEACNRVFIIDERGVSPLALARPAVSAIMADEALTVVYPEGDHLLLASARSDVAFAGDPHGRLLALGAQRFGWLEHTGLLVLDLAQQRTFWRPFVRELSPAFGWIESEPPDLLLVDADGRLYRQELE